MTSAAEQNLVRRWVPKLLTLGPRDPRIGDRPSPWGRGGRREGFRGLHSPQINQPSASRPEVQPQKAITALGTLNLDRLHSFSADSRDKDTGSRSPPVQQKHVFLFSNRIFVQRNADYAKPQWKTLIWMKATEELTVQFRWESGSAYIMVSANVNYERQWDEREVLHFQGWMRQFTQTLDWRVTYGWH